jgi:hypothetical protein
LFRLTYRVPGLSNRKQTVRQNLGLSKKNSDLVVMFFMSDVARVSADEMLRII